MLDYGTVRSTVRPNAMVVDEQSVWVNTDITEVSENIGEQNEFKGFEFNQVRYEKDEYIRFMAEQNNELNEILNTLLGVTSDE